jgi:hypothetical protein
VLAAGDSNGRVTLFGPGLLPLARLDFGGGGLLALAVGEGCASVAALLGGPAGTSLAVANAAPLAAAAVELRRVCHAARHVRAAAVAASAAVCAAAASAADASTAVASLLASLDALTADHGEPGGGAACLRRVALTGRPSPALAHALAAAPGPAGLRKAARAADAAAAAAVTALRGSGEPAADAAAHWAAELAAVAAAAPWATPLGVTQACADAVACLARDAVASVAAARLAAIAAAVEGRALFAWLLALADAEAGAGGAGGDGAALPSSDSAAAAAALGEGSARKRLTAALVGDGRAATLLPLPPALAAAFGPRAPRAGPPGALAAELGAAVDALLASVSAALSPRLAPGPSRDVGPAADAGSASLHALDEGAGVAGAWVGGGGREVVALSAVNAGAALPPLAHLAVTRTPLPPGWAAAAAAPYRGGRLAVLAADARARSLLALLPPADERLSESSWPPDAPTRVLVGMSPAPPLAVGPARGVAAALTGGGRRVTVLDLEDEDEGGAGSGSDGGDM